MMRSARESGVPDGGRGQRKKTHEVFPCIPSCERGARKARKNAQMLQFTPGSIAQ